MLNYYVLEVDAHLINACFIFVRDVMLYNPVNSIITTNKLIGPNYVDWKRNLDIVHISKELKWVT